MTEPQVEHLRRTVKKTSRNPHRDSAMILLAYRHGLRVGELTDLRWEDVHLDRAKIYVRRLNGSKSTMQPLLGDELRALRKLWRENTSSLPFAFISEQGGPLSIDAVEYMLKRAGQAAGLPHVHPHMLRHGCGYRLVNQGANTRTIQDYLGHRDSPAHRDLHRGEREPLNFDSAAASAIPKNNEVSMRAGLPDWMATAMAFRARRYAMRHRKASRGTRVRIPRGRPLRRRRHARPSAS